VRRLISWTAGVVGIAALARLLARERRHRKQAASAPPTVDDRAEALRRKLDETRATEEAAQAPPADETPREPLEQRRARVHAKAQEAIEAMQEPLG
jgi:phage shock protein A